MKICSKELRVPPWLDEVGAAECNLRPAPLLPIKWSKNLPQDVRKMREIQLLLAERGVLYQPVSLHFIITITGWGITYLNYLTHRLTRSGLVQRYRMQRLNAKAESEKRYYFNFGATADKQIGAVSDT